MSVRILASDSDEPVEIPRALVDQSVLIKEMLADDDDDTPEIPLPNIQTVTLKKIVEFLQHFAHDPLPYIDRPLTTTNLKDAVKAEWYSTYIEAMEQAELFSIILGANYLDISPLLDLGCARIATMIKGKSPDEIRKQFNIKEVPKIVEAEKYVEETK